MTPDFETLRAKFPGAERRTYLDVCGRALASNELREAVDLHIAELESGTVNKDRYFELIERTREQFAGLIGAANAGDVAITKNVSDGLNCIASAILWKPGDNVVVCADLEHPNNLYPWLNLRDRYGIEVRLIPSEEGDYDTNQMIAAIDDRTVLLTVSSVTFSPGHRCDLAALGQACRDRGVFFLVDGAQSVGVLDIDVEALCIDGLAVGTQKALLGLYGFGFLYCRERWAKDMRPGGLARFGVSLGKDAHEWAAGDADYHASSADYKLMRGAKRFDLGNYNYPGAVAAEVGLALVSECGIANVERYATSLAGLLSDGLDSLGIPVVRSADSVGATHIVSVGTWTRNEGKLNGGFEAQSLYDYLIANDVSLSERRGMLRFSFHLYNNEDDVNRVLDLAAKWQKRSHAPGRRANQ